MENIKSKFVYGGTSDYGYQRENNEDFLVFDALREDILLAVVADGAGSRQCGIALQPAVIAASEVVEAVRRIYTANPVMLEQFPNEVLRESIMVANRIIGTFKVANDELYSGFGVCLSCCLIVGDRFYVAHCGNTRVYLIRHVSDGSARILQLTRDHTKASEMVADGILSQDEYYSHPGRYRFTSGLGFVSEPTIQSYSAGFKLGDLLVLTSDGIHYAIRPEYISDIILSTGNWEDATKSLIEAAKMQKMSDNMTVAVIYNLPADGGS